MRGGLFASRSPRRQFNREPIGREHFLDHKLNLEQVNCKVKVFCGLGLISKDPSCLTDFDPYVIDEKAEYFRKSRMITVGDTAPALHFPRFPLTLS